MFKNSIIQKKSVLKVLIFKKQTPKRSSMQKELWLRCNVKSGCKLDDDMAGEDYVPRQVKRMTIHDSVQGNTLGAVDQKKQRYVVTAEKGGDVTGAWRGRITTGYVMVTRHDFIGPCIMVNKIVVFCQLTVACQLSQTITAPQ